MKLIDCGTSGTCPRCTAVLAKGWTKCGMCGFMPPKEEEPTCPTCGKTTMSFEIGNKYRCEPSQPDAEDFAKAHQVEVPASFEVTLVRMGTLFPIVYIDELDMLVEISGHYLYEMPRLETAEQKVERLQKRLDAYQKFANEMDDKFEYCVSYRPDFVLYVKERLTVLGKAIAATA